MEWTSKMEKTMALSLVLAVAAVCRADVRTELFNGRDLAGWTAVVDHDVTGGYAASEPTWFVTNGAPSGLVRAIVETSLGDIALELDSAKAPVTVSNFVAYAQSGHYDGTVFHRVIGGFMIQGGGFTAEMEQKPTRAPIRNEAANGLKNARGTIAMARTMVVDSATSQFFINLKDNGFLDHTAPDPRQYGYAVFGRVTKGMDVVDRIAQVRTGNVGYFQDVPVEPVVIKSVKIAE